MARVVSATKARTYSQTDWRDKVRQARAQMAAELGEQDLPPAETIIRQMREERDAQLVDLR